jgi:hypothetical protein
VLKRVHCVVEMGTWRHGKAVLGEFGGEGERGRGCETENVDSGCEVCVMDGRKAVFEARIKVRSAGARCAIVMCICQFWWSSTEIGGTSKCSELEETLLCRGCEGCET